MRARSRRAGTRRATRSRATSRGSASTTTTSRNSSVTSSTPRGTRSCGCRQSNSSEFNSHLVGHIDVIAAYFGDGFRRHAAGASCTRRHRRTRTSVFRALARDGELQRGRPHGGRLSESQKRLLQLRVLEAACGCMADFPSPEAAQGFVAQLGAPLPLALRIAAADRRRDLRCRAGKCSRLPRCETARSRRGQAWWLLYRVRFGKLKPCAGAAGGKPRRR